MNDPVKVLMEMTDEMVYAKDIAPILKMPADRIVFYAKNGKWDTDKWGNFIISGDDPKTSHVKFFRKDFLVKCGFMEPEKEERTTEQLILEQITALNEGLTMVCQMLTLMMKPYQLDVLQELIDKKTAGAGTPTE